MSRPIIEVRGVSKRYRIGTESTGQFQTLRDRLVGTFRPLHLSSKEFWALQNVSFDVLPGEVLGIIGANGAGKSTLLKILSRITEPTQGEIILRGRVASLLEVGTGFHPELTGKENIFLRGVILGMKRAEVARKFDEIVAFSGVEKFLSTPVKRYSSGMYVRLAFAVAAHLEPEILIVDEVLAVGDAEFQEKCLGKMRSLSQEVGRTVLFVSHNFPAVQSLCSRGILLGGGEVKFSGSALEATQTYQQLTKRNTDGSLLLAERAGNGCLRMRTAKFQTPDGQSPITGLPCQLEVVVDCIESVRNLCVAVTVRNDANTRIFHVSSGMLGHVFPVKAGERIAVRFQIERLPLPFGRYEFALQLSEGPEIFDYLPAAGSFVVTEGDFYGTGRNPRPSGGVILIDGKWEKEGLAIP